MAPGPEQQIQTINKLAELTKTGAAA